jgi:hypothetical protein
MCFSLINANNVNKHTCYVFPQSLYHSEIAVNLGVRFSKRKGRMYCVPIWLTIYFHTPKTDFLLYEPLIRVDSCVLTARNITHADDMRISPFWLLAFQHQTRTFVCGTRLLWVYFHVFYHRCECIGGIRPDPSEWLFRVKLLILD